MSYMTGQTSRSSSDWVKFGAGLLIVGLVAAIWQFWGGAVLNLLKPSSAGAYVVDASEGGSSSAGAHVASVFSKKKPYSLYCGNHEVRECDARMHGIIGKPDIGSTKDGRMSFVFETPEQAKNFTPQASFTSEDIYDGLKLATYTRDLKAGFSLIRTGEMGMLEKIRTHGREVEISCGGKTGMMLIRIHGKNFCVKVE